MKKSFYKAALYFLILILSNKKSLGQTTPLLDSLLSIDKAQFIGKPLDSIIAVLPQNYSTIRIVSGDNWYTARNLRIKYAGEIWIDLHVRTFNYMTPRDSTRTWNITLMRKENLYDIAIYNDTRCYTGCDLK